MRDSQGPSYQQGGGGQGAVVLAEANYGQQSRGRESVQKLVALRPGPKAVAGEAPIESQEAVRFCAVLGIVGGGVVEHRRNMEVLVGVGKTIKPCSRGSSKRNRL